MQMMNNDDVWREEEGGAKLMEKGEGAGILHFQRRSLVAVIKFYSIVLTLLIVDLEIDGDLRQTCSSWIIPSLKTA